jgi:nicotinamidase-related amidase
MAKGFTEETTGDPPRKCALFVDGAKELIPHINEWIEDAEQDDIIIHINDAHKLSDPELQFLPIHCMKGHEESDKANGFIYGGRAHFMIYKNSFSAFKDTPLHSVLTTMKIREIEVVGVCTEICVLQTVIDAVLLGYEVYIDSNSVEGLTDEGHIWALNFMEDILGVSVV